MRPIVFIRAMRPLFFRIWGTGKDSAKENWMRTRNRKPEAMCPVFWLIGSLHTQGYYGPARGM